jgi:hypothetical protein
VLSAVDFRTHTVVVVATGIVSVITVPGGTVCEGVTVYVDPLTAVIVVPGVTPVPDRTAPTTNGPPDVSVSTVPAIPPTPANWNVWFAAGRGCCRVKRSTGLLILLPLAAPDGWYALLLRANEYMKTPGSWYGLVPLAKR